MLLRFYFRKKHTLANFFLSNPIILITLDICINQKKKLSLLYFDIAHFTALNMWAKNIDVYKRQAVGPSKERISKFKEYFHLKDHLLPVAVVAVGYSAEDKTRIDQYDPEKVSYYR